MDNFDFVSHLAGTADALDASSELVENLLRAYYNEMHTVAAKWSPKVGGGAEQLDEAFAELNSTHQKYWLPATRFTEYWQPALEPPETYEISELGVKVFSDMLGNFIAIVGANKRTVVFLLSVVRDELRIVNRFFC